MIRKILLFVSVLFVPVIGMSQMKAIFGADTTYGCDSLTVQFLDSSIATNIDNWYWDFGNGKTDTIKNPIMTFDTAGVYTVKLKVSNSTLSDSVTKTNYITIRKKPTASFTATIHSNSIGETSLSLATFHYLLQDKSVKDTLQYKYYWDFGTGSFVDSVSKMVYKFQKEGTYDLRMIIDAGYGCFDTAFNKIEVKEELIIPNVFTPNGDGTNDVFFIRTNGNEVFRFSVYNRFGALVYLTEAKHISWDGRTHAGVFLKSGTYYYVLESDTRKEVGFVLLNR